jgi:hypothetical protein
VIGAWLCRMSEARPAVTSASIALKRNANWPVLMKVPMARMASQPPGAEEHDQRDEDGEAQAHEEERGKLLQRDLHGREVRPPGQHDQQDQRQIAPADQESLATGSRPSDVSSQASRPSIATAETGPSQPAPVSMASRLP